MGKFQIVAVHIRLRHQLEIILNIILNCKILFCLRFAGDRFGCIYKDLLTADDEAVEKAEYVVSIIFHRDISHFMAGIFRQVEVIGRLLYL